MRHRQRQITEQAARLLTRLETLVPPDPETMSWGHYAYRWRRGRLQSRLEPIERPDLPKPSDLLHVGEQRARLARNTAQFVRGYPANNALLWGARGTGKSTLIKAMLTSYAREGLRLIAVNRDALADLVDIVEPLYGRPERFVLYADDLGFEPGEPGYRTLKALLDGALATIPDNVLIYATSNRRHLLAEPRGDNDDVAVTSTEIHPGEAVEERISLSERFGLWLAFHPFSQQDYLEIVYHWVARLGGADEISGEALRAAALRYALHRGSRSGRVARQFATDWVGDHKLSQCDPDQGSAINRPRATSMAKVVLNFEGAPVGEFYIQGRQLLIGRKQECDIQIASQAVSGQHARLIPGADGTVVIEDLISTNGTFINGEKISRRTLKAEDTIVIGDHELVFVATAPGEADAGNWSVADAVSESDDDGREMTSFMRGKRTVPRPAAEPESNRSVRLVLIIAAVVGLIAIALLVALVVLNP